MMLRSINFKILLLLTLLRPSSFAFSDGTLFLGDVVLEELKDETRSSEKLLEGCQGAVAACDIAVAKLLSGYHIARIKLQGGVVMTSPFAENGLVEPATNVHLETLGIETPAVSMEVGTFDVTYFPSKGGVRLNLTIGNVQAAFFCTNPKGKAVVPGFSRIQHYCQPDAIAGVGASLGTLQWDPNTGQFAGRWAAFNGILNVYGNGHGFEYLSRHLNLVYGIDVDTVWSGSNDLHNAGEPQTHLRLVLGANAIFRSENYRWESDFQITARPALAGAEGAFGDITVDAQVNAMHHLFIHSGTIGTVGATGSLSYCQNPIVCIGPFASSTSKLGLYTGLTYRMSFDLLQL